MNKRVVWALSLIVLCVVVFIFNHQKIELEFGLFKTKAIAGLVYLGFTSIGVVIGAILR